MPGKEAQGYALFTNKTLSGFELQLILLIAATQVSRPLFLVLAGAGVGVNDESGDNEDDRSLAGAYGNANGWMETRCGGVYRLRSWPDIRPDSEVDT